MMNLMKKKKNRNFIYSKYKNLNTKKWNLSKIFWIMSEQKCRGIEN